MDEEWGNADGPDDPEDNEALCSPEVTPPVSLIMETGPTVCVAEHFRFLASREVALLQICRALKANPLVLP